MTRAFNTWICLQWPPHGCAYNSLMMWALANWLIQRKELLSSITKRGQGTFMLMLTGCFPFCLFLAAYFYLHERLYLHGPFHCHTCFFVVYGPSRLSTVYVTFGFRFKLKEWNRDVNEIVNKMIHFISYFLSRNKYYKFNRNKNDLFHSNKTIKHNFFLIPWEWVVSFFHWFLLSKHIISFFLLLFFFSP